MKKLLALLLTLALAFALALPAVFAEEEDPRITEVLAIIEEYNATHGGTGALSASYKPERTYYRWTITGEVIGATKGIAFSNRSAANWNATLIGETQGEPMLKGFSSISILGGEIKTNGLAVESIMVSISQGSISGNEAIRASSILINGGTVIGNANVVTIGAANFIASGGIFTGRICCEDGSVYLSENAVVNVAALSAKSVLISDEAQLHFIGDGSVTVSGDTYISIRAKITGNSARTFISDATLEYDHAYYPLKFIWTGPIVQFILRWVFFPQAMLSR